MFFIKNKCIAYENSHFKVCRVRVHVYSILGGISVRLWVIVALKLAFGVPTMR